MNEEFDDDDWRPATIEEVSKILKEDLATCDGQQVAAFSSYAIEPRYAPITRYGKNERVVIVAQRGDEVIYWEDAEEGFNLSPMPLTGGFLSIGATRTGWGTRLTLGSKGGHSSEN